MYLKFICLFLLLDSAFIFYFFIGYLRLFTIVYLDNNLAGYNYLVRFSFSLLGFSLFWYVCKYLVAILFRNRIASHLTFNSSSVLTYLIQSQAWWLWCLVRVSNKQLNLCRIRRSPALQ